MKRNLDAILGLHLQNPLSHSFLFFFVFVFPSGMHPYIRSIILFPSSPPFSQCGNYGIGGHYGIHPDFYDYDLSAFVDESRTINRISTVMNVFDAPLAGGATVFPFLGISIFPEKGSAAFWFNTKDDAVPDQLTLHSACPVLLGQKWSKYNTKQI